MYKKLYYNEINDCWVIPLAIVNLGTIKYIDFEDEYIRKNIQYKIQYNNNNNFENKIFEEIFHYLDNDEMKKKNRQLCCILLIKFTDFYFNDIIFDVNIYCENKNKKISSKMLDYKILKKGDGSSFEMLYLIPLNPLIVTFKSFEKIGGTLSPPNPPPLY